MYNNPWQVDGIEEFSYFHCPECSFVVKDESLFQDHALENHPLSFGLFGKNLEESDITNMVKIEMSDSENASFTFDEPTISKMKKSSANDGSFLEESKDDFIDPLAVDHTVSIKTESQSFIIKDFPAHSETNLKTVSRLEDKKLFPKFKETGSKCKQCGDKFEDKRELKGHILSVHKNKELYRCSTCNVW